MGVLAHVLQTKVDAAVVFLGVVGVDGVDPPHYGRLIHYALMPIAVGLIVAGVVVAAQHRTDRGRTLLEGEHSHHRPLGYVILGLLGLQVLWGTALHVARMPPTSAVRPLSEFLKRHFDTPWTSIAHRVSGFLLLVALAVAAALIVRPGTSLEEFKHGSAIRWAAVAAAAVAAVTAVLVVGNNAGWRPPRTTALFESFL